jgi:hypothetical protein
MALAALREILEHTAQEALIVMCGGEAARVNDAVVPRPNGRALGVPRRRDVSMRAVKDPERRRRAIRIRRHVPDDREGRPRGPHEHWDVAHDERIGGRADKRGEIVRLHELP